MIRPILAIAVLACLQAAQGRAAAIAQTNRNGRVQCLDLAGDPVPIHTDLRIPLEGWKPVWTLDAAREVESSAIEGGRKWAGRIEVKPKEFYHYQQTLREADGAVQLTLRVTAETDVKTPGVFFWLDLPIALFGGGTCELRGEAGVVGSAPLPREQPPTRQFLAGLASQAVFAAPGSPLKLAATFEPPCPMAIQDNRVWRSATYSALVKIPGTPLAKGQAASLNVTLRLAGEGDLSPARLTLEAARPRYRLDGFGGNYCFGIESPVTQYTLDHLRVAWARTEMTPAEWEPENDNASPQDTNWAALTANDKPDSNLRREFLLARQIQKRGIPYSITIWHLPEWLYADPRTDDQRPNGRRIAPDKWPELLECLGSYLVYAKKQYGVEPDLFSFNEPDGGVRVKFGPEEHRDAIKRIGAHFEKLGLKTKMLLADTCHARGTHTYAAPTAADPEALRHVGALSFHSWGGATPEEYAAWADLADALKRPLLVGELGVDAWAWRGGSYDSFHYGLREVQMYQELVLHARPRATMHWEFTSDYALVKAGPDGKLVPTARFWFVKHFCNLTPPQAEVLATASDNPKVLFTAFRGEGPVFTFHIANLGAARRATVVGLPAGLNSLRAVQTGESDSFKELAPVAVEDRVARLSLARQSLLTLTTAPVGAGLSPPK